MELSAYLEIEADRQGSIAGSSQRRGREGMIEILEFAHCVEIPVGLERATNAGQTTHRPLEVLKEIDKSSPKLMQALCEQERLSSAVFSWYRFTAKGKEELYYRVELRNASILRIEPWTPAVNEQGQEWVRFMERVRFSYERIVWSWGEDANVEYETEWADRMTT